MCRPRTRHRRPRPRRHRVVAGVDGLVLQHFAILADEDGDRHAPGALARQQSGRSSIMERRRVWPCAGTKRVASMAFSARCAASCRRQAACPYGRTIAVCCGRSPASGAPAMRVAVLQPTAREQHAALDQRVDDGLVSVALLAVVVDDTRRPARTIRAEARRVLR